MKRIYENQLSILKDDIISLSDRLNVVEKATLIPDSNTNSNYVIEKSINEMLVRQKRSRNIIVYGIDESSIITQVVDDVISVFESIATCSDTFKN